MRVWVDLTNSPADPDEVSVERRERHDDLRVRRDPRELVKLLLSAIDS
jgi:hypothetical protein